MTLFDLGAHFALFSLVAAHFAGNSVALDPSPLAVKIAHNQLFLNNAAERVRILQAAVSDATGSVAMLSAGVYSDGYFRLARGRSSKELAKVPAMTIDQLAGQFGAPTHVKIDVEGHEAAVLRGGIQTLKTAAPILFLELHNEIIAADGGDPGETLEQLQASGYDTFSSRGEPLERDAILGQPLVHMVARPSRRPKHNAASDTRS